MSSVPYNQDKETETAHGRKDVFIIDDSLFDWSRSKKRTFGKRIKYKKDNTCLF